MPDLEQTIAKIEEQLSTAREDDNLGRVTEEGASPEVVRLGELAALYRRDGILLDLLERRRKAVAEEIRAQVDLGSKLEIAGLQISHVQSSWFDAKAYQEWCRGPFGEPDAKAALAALDAWKEHEASIRAENSIIKSSGVRVTVAKL
jgi:hypothetical protein